MNKYLISYPNARQLVNTDPNNIIERIIRQNNRRYTILTRVGQPDVIGLIAQHPPIGMVDGVELDMKLSK